MKTSQSLLQTGMLRQFSRDIPLQLHDMMFTLRDKDTGTVVGTITNEDFQLMQDLFEEESTTDTDYYIQSGTIDLLQAENGSADLIKLLRDALGSRDGMEVEWSEQ